MRSFWIIGVIMINPMTNVLVRDRRGEAHRRKGCVDAKPEMGVMWP